ncbi:MAG: cytochrome c biogenesis heme-transporting ATPase CcmA [Leptospirillia bacterium]
MNQTLEAVNLTCVRGDRRLFEDVAFSLGRGELLHVRGPNGAGKTTLLRMICGLVRPVAGTILWGGEPIASLGDDYHRQMIYVGHKNAIKDDLTGRENLLISSRISGFRVSQQDAAAALSRMGLKGYDRLPASVLSQGQRRRTALARLLVTKAPLWVLDEPFNALDVDAVKTLQDAIGAHITAGGMALLTTHQEVAIEGGRVTELRLGS